MDSLYSNPLSLVIGAFTGVVISVYTAFSVNDPAIHNVAFALTAVVAFRIAVIVAHRFLSREDSRTLELLFEAGAFAYAVAVGAMATFAIASAVNPLAQMVLTVYAVGYATAIAPRNAGRPVIALGQMLLIMGPISIGLFTRDEPLAQALGLVALLHIPSVITITFKVYGSLRSSIVSAQENAEQAEEMQHLARTDVVTGLANRAGLNHAMTETMADLTDDATIALIWIDLDRFKEVNDLLGHPVGDRVLEGVARRLQDVTPDKTTVARFGGDEFIVFCPVKDMKHAELIASEIHCEIMCPMRVDGELLEIRASLGVALLPDNAGDADQLMQRADLALYHAKVGGRAQTCFYDPSMSRDLVRRREIEAELRQAIQRDELSIFFQPIVDLETSRIKSFEALVRWFHPEKGELRPDEFIPVAEETGVIVTLGNWITAQAARIAATWPDDVTVAVNLSPLQIRAPGAALGVKNALREAGLDPHRLELEVTESLFIEDNHSTSAFIQELSELGVRFALDDFGTGYSSLSYINSFPFSKIKVDRSFVSGAQAGQKSEAIIQAVAKMGNTLGMDIVAEGLETADQVQAVRKAGCTLGQGFHFSRAVPDYLAAMLLAQERDTVAQRAKA
ncbi:MAG: EAL domain-containing protein [Pseudomonadota bacterium]